jgi:hypothetical protein
MNLYLKRPAIAMIELIFAIVIMGIVLMSAPMLISTAVQSTSVALQQEGINEATSRINMILTYPWDQNDINDSCIPPVLHVTAGDSELDEVANTGRRVGVPLGTNSHTFRCGDKKFNASTIATDGLDDMDDFAGTTSLVEESSGSGGVDYIERTTINIATIISYSSDSASYNSSSISYVPGTGSSTTNIKKINVTLTSTSGISELNKTITLNAFSCNIGGYEYASREIP